MNLKKYRELPDYMYQEIDSGKIFFNQLFVTRAINYRIIHNYIQQNTITWKKLDKMLKKLGIEWYKLCTKDIAFLTSDNDYVDEFFSNKKIVKVLDSLQLNKLLNADFHESTSKNLDKKYKLISTGQIIDIQNKPNRLFISMNKVVDNINGYIYAPSYIATPGKPNNISLKSITKMAKKLAKQQNDRKIIKVSPGEIDTSDFNTDMDRKETYINTPLVDALLLYYLHKNDYKSTTYKEQLDKELNKEQTFYKFISQYYANGSVTHNTPIELYDEDILNINKVEQRKFKKIKDIVYRILENANTDANKYHVELIRHQKALANIKNIVNSDVEINQLLKERINNEANLN